MTPMTLGPRLKRALRGIHEFRRLSLRGYGAAGADGIVLPATPPVRLLRNNGDAPLPSEDRMRNTSVHITRDGTTLVNSEPIPVPQGVDPPHAVLEHLTLEAAGAGQPLVADIRDDRNGQVLRLQINPDGTTAPLAANERPAATPSIRTITDAPTAPPPPFPDLYQADFEAIIAAGRAHQFAPAIVQADRLLANISSSHGSQHPSTLTTAQIRADLAWMTADYPYATELWTFIATSWKDTLGPRTGGASRSARQAVACWLLAEPQPALRLGKTVLAMLEAIAPEPHTNPTVLSVQRRLNQLTTH